MKKLIAMLLAVLTILSMAACNAEQPQEETQAPTEAARDYSEFAGIVADTKTWYEKLMSMPIASQDMTERELRQLCSDAFRMNQTFTWTPTTDISYSFTLLERTSEVFLPKGIAYAGLCYCNNDARGNVWKALEYYDHETGAMDIEAMNGAELSILSSACARGCEWGWSRVSNSHGLETMISYSQHASRVTPVGPYTYAPGRYAFSDGPGTLDIIADNGEDVMLQSYAAAQMADGLYSSSSYHVMMFAEDPVIVYHSDGSIDAEQSYALVHEQDAIGSKTENKNYTQDNGVIMRPLGTADKKYTFRQLLDKGYIPFTLPELIGTDPVEPGEAYLGTAQKRIENGQDISFKELLSNNLNVNYALCTVEIQVKDADGNVVYSFKPSLRTTPMTFTAPLGNDDLLKELPAYVNGTNTIHVYARMANGELIEAVNTILKGE